MGSTKFRRVTREEPCPVCDHPDWCSFSTTGPFVWCNRILNKSGGHFHKIGDGVVEHTTHKQRVVTQKRGSVEHLDSIYRILGAKLGLSSLHENSLLRERRLPYEALSTFASLRGREKHNEIVAEIVQHFGEFSLYGVPGFRQHEGVWSLYAPDRGLLVPYPNIDGKILGYQIRSDLSSQDLHTRSLPRYIWLSSTGQTGGTSSGAPIAVWRPEKIKETSTIWITEGSLKACITAYHLDSAVIGIPGVMSWSQSLKLLPPKTRCVIAFDKDVPARPAVVECEKLLIEKLVSWGRSVSIATWNPGESGQYKGIDDCIISYGTLDYIEGKEWLTQKTAA